MLKGYIWLTALHVAMHFHMLQASDDREYVHIKVHMPNVLRKHNHHFHHKMKKYLHHQPRYRPPKKALMQHLQQQHQPIDADFLYAHENVGPQFFPTPQLPALPEPELVSDDGYETDIMSAMFEGDATGFSQPYRPAVPPPPMRHTTQVPQLRQQLMQQLFTPEMMAALVAGVGSNSGDDGGGGGSSGGGGGSSGGGGGSDDDAGGSGEESNSVMANELLAELEKEYLKKFHKQRIHAEKLTQSREKKKRKKFNKDSSNHRKQHYYEQQLQPYSNNNKYQDNNIFAAHLQQPFKYLQQTQQPQQQDYDDDLDGQTGNFDDKSSNENEDFIGDSSYQDMFAAYTQQSTTPMMQPQPTQPNHLTWWQYQQQLQQLQQDQQLQQQQQQQTDHFMMPSVRLAPTPYTLPLTSSTVGATAATTSSSSLLKSGQTSKSRKNRPKSKRNRYGLL